MSMDAPVPAGRGNRGGPCNQRGPNALGSKRYRLSRSGVRAGELHGWLLWSLPSSSPRRRGSRRATLEAPSHPSRFWIPAFAGLTEGLSAVSKGHKGPTSIRANEPVSVRTPEVVVFKVQRANGTLAEHRPVGKLPQVNLPATSSRPGPSVSSTVGKSDSATAKQPSLRPSMPCWRVIASETDQAP